MPPHPPSKWDTVWQNIKPPLQKMLHRPCYLLLNMWKEIHGQLPMKLKILQFMKIDIISFKLTKVRGVCFCVHTQTSNFKLIISASYIKTVRFGLP